MKLITLALCLTAVSAFAVDFFADFEEPDYTVGDDLADSIYWMKNEGGDFFIANDGGDQIIDADFTHGDPIYVALGAGFNEDFAVDVEFEFNGYESYVALVGRLDPDTEIAYAAGLFFHSTYITGIGIYHIEGDTQTELTATAVVPPISANSWHNLKFEITGSNPVQLTAYVNGSSVANYSDSTYLIPTGLCGLTTYFDSSAPTIHYDDFNIVEDTGTGIETTSLGSLKATFK